jgi:ketosteroid isomerase-like protein
MDHFNDDATFSAPGYDLRGKDEILRFYQESAARFPGLAVEVGHVTGGGSNAAIEWRATFTTPTGRTVPLHGVNVIETANGKFQRVRVYYDSQELDRER